MNEQSQTQQCARCGATVAPGTLQGLCPRCLLALNLATQTEIPGDNVGPAGAPVIKPPPAPAPSPEEIAGLFPQFEILECLGRGGMGAVYKARQPRLDRFVALKILLPERHGGGQFAERFAREARALARLNHPAIVAVHDFGEAGGYPYLVMEYVEGLSLRQLLQRGKLAPEEALTIVPKICEALQFAHEQGIVHRDIKPENILLDKQGLVKIADFGIAKILAPGAQDFSLTGGKDVVGTPHYMAPEQVEQPTKVDHRADIFSLGVVFYEMLTGELPLGKFQPPSSKVLVDVRLDEIVLHALEKAPERRYQHASEVKTDVEAIATTSTPHRTAGTAAARLRDGGQIKVGSLPELLPGERIVHFKKWLWAISMKSLPTYRLFFSLPPLWAAGLYVTNRRLLFIAHFFGFGQEFSVWFSKQAVEGQGDVLTNVSSGASRCFGGFLEINSEAPQKHWWRARELRLRIYTGQPETLERMIATASSGEQEGPASEPPPAAREPGGLPSEAVRRQARWAAAGLLVTGGLNLLGAALVLLLATLGVVAVRTGADLEGALNLLPEFLDSPGHETARVVFAGLWGTWTIASGLTFSGGMHLLRLKRWRLCVTAGGLAITLTPGGLIGLPLGIWALVVLNRRDVRAAFEAEASRRRVPHRDAAWAGAARTAARCLGTLWGLLFVVVFVAEGSPPLPMQPGAVQVQFAALALMLAGVAAGWWRDGLPALLLLGGWSLFHVAEGHVPPWSLFHVAAVVGVLFALAWRGRQPAAAGDEHPMRRVLTTGAIAGSPVLFALVLNLASQSLAPARLVTISGTVTDFVTGKPIAGARVDDNRYGAGTDRAPRQAWTDTNGHYQLETFYEEHTLAASAPGHEPALATFLTKPLGFERARQLDFRLRPVGAGGLARAGSVNQQTSAPVAQSPREVVAEWLRRVKAGRQDSWDLTTRKNVGAGPYLTELWEYDRIRPLHQFGNAEQMMVVSNPFTDNSGRARVFYAMLIRRGDRWLVARHDQVAPGDASRLMQGFFMNPGMKFDVMAEELVGHWLGPCIEFTLAADGTGVWLVTGPEGPLPKPEPFRWEVRASTFVLRDAGREVKTEITWVEDDTFHFTYPNGEARAVWRRELSDESTGSAATASNRVAVPSPGPSATAPEERPAGPGLPASPREEIARIRVQQAEQELKRIQELFAQKRVSESIYERAQAALAAAVAEQKGDTNAIVRLKLQLAEQEFKRTRDLYQQKLVSEAEFQRAKANAEIAAAELRAAEAAAKP